MVSQISIKYKKKMISGNLIKEDEDYITLKLDSGYNVILNKKNIDSRKFIGGDNTSNITNLNKDKINETLQKDLPKIVLLHTGGTIASKIDYKTGAVYSKFTVNEILSLYPQLTKKAKIIPKMISNLSSEDIRFVHYNLLLSAIKDSIKDKIDGIIISHGTDTMHYTSLALWYASKNLNIPIILVGAQRSSDRPSSDSFLNLDAAIDFILENKKLEFKYNRVGICMHQTINDDGNFLILDSINSKKMHSSRRDAFMQINYLPFCKIKNRKLEILREDLLTKKPKNDFSYIKYNENLKIGFFKAHPNLFPEEILNLKIYDGLIIEGTGLGHLAVSESDKYTKINLENLKAIENLIKKTKIIVGVQTVYGQTNMNVYSSGRYILKTGVLGQNMNLITETLFCRLAFCLSQKEKSFEDMWNENLEGFILKSLDYK